MAICSVRLTLTYLDLFYIRFQVCLRPILLIKNHTITTIPNVNSKFFFLKKKKKGRKREQILRA